jgi:hypothetical protein
MVVSLAEVAQLAERNLAKVEVAGSNPVFRSIVGRDRPPSGDVAEWLGAGLQNPLHRFDSGRRLEGDAQSMPPFIASRLVWCLAARPPEWDPSFDPRLDFGAAAPGLVERSPAHRISRCQDHHISTVGSQLAWSSQTGKVHHRLSRHQHRQQGHSSPESTVHHIRLPLQSHQESLRLSIFRTASTRTDTALVISQIVKRKKVTAFVKLVKFLGRRH